MSKSDTMSPQSGMALVNINGEDVLVRYIDSIAGVAATNIEVGYIHDGKAFDVTKVGSVLEPSQKSILLIETGTKKLHIRISNMVAAGNVVDFSFREELTVTKTDFETIPCVNRDRNMASCSMESTFSYKTSPAITDEGTQIKPYCMRGETSGVSLHQSTQESSDQKPSKFILCPDTVYGLIMHNVGVDHPATIDFSLFCYEI